MQYLFSFYMWIFLLESLNLITIKIKPVISNEAFIFSGGIIALINPSQVFFLPNQYFYLALS